MKSVENGIDLGMGILVIILCMSTALFGLTRYAKQELYNGLNDKNTVNVEGTVLPTDTVIIKEDHELAIALLAAAQNRDNIRRLTIVIKEKNAVEDENSRFYDPSKIYFKQHYSLIENYEDTMQTIEDAIQEFLSVAPIECINRYYAGLANPNTSYVQKFVTSDQSNITCYILLSK